MNKLKFIVSEEYSNPELKKFPHSNFTKFIVAHLCLNFLVIY